MSRASTDGFIKRIADREITIAVVGLGYVGLPLAVAFARSGLKTVGIDTSPEVVRETAAGRTKIGDVDPTELARLVDEDSFAATTDFAVVKECDAVLLCVPTPLDRYRKPDMSYIEVASTQVGRNLQRSTLVALESTTYPTTTEDLVRPILERESGLVAERDFWLCYSPERVDPGNAQFRTANTPKVVGALGDEGGEVAVALYSVAIEQVHRVSTPRVAEMVKILENTYRLVNISLINELALLCNRMEIDIWEVIDAAKTKPYGFQAFYPGPGIGGHCIPLDPFYLEYIAKGMNFDLTMIHSAGQVDNLMPHRMLVRISYALNKQKKPLNGSSIFFLGVAYKADINDDRESPALKIIDEAARKGAIVSYHDPYIPEIRTAAGRQLTSVGLDERTLQTADAVVITTDHGVFDPDSIVRDSRLVIDLRNLIKKRAPHVYKL